jgi:hypothetical protein
MDIFVNSLVFHFRIPVKQNDGIPAASLCQILPVTKNYTILPIESNDKLQPSHTSQNIFTKIGIQIYLDMQLFYVTVQGSPYLQTIWRLDFSLEEHEGEVKE